MKRHVDALVREALSDVIAEGGLRTRTVPAFTIDAPRHAAFGDLACDVALVLGRQLGESPEAIGGRIVDRVHDPHGWLAEVGVGGPGFVNFRFAPPFWRTLLAEALEAGDTYGRSDAGIGRRILVEVAGAGAGDAGDARAAAVADAVGRLLGDAGAVVERAGSVAGLVAADGGEGVPGRAPFGRLVGVLAGRRDGALPHLQRTLATRGVPGATLRVLPVHPVRLSRDGEPMRDAARVEALVDEIGPDALRFLLLLQRAERSVDLDLELAKREGTENPLFLVRYARARLGRRRREGEDVCARAGALVDVDLDQLAGGELDVLRTVAAWPDVVDAAVRALEPDRVARFAVELAGAAHRWLNRYRLADARPARAAARLALAACLERLLARALIVCTGSVPEGM